MRGIKEMKAYNFNFIRIGLLQAYYRYSLWWNQQTLNKCSLSPVMKIRLDYSRRRVLVKVMKYQIYSGDWGFSTSRSGPDQYLKEVKKLELYMCTTYIKT